jgi:hypothetical protein
MLRFTLLKDYYTVSKSALILLFSAAFLIPTGKILSQDQSTQQGTLKDLTLFDIKIDHIISEMSLE